ncbi:Gfo/Idh/MocA family protein [Crateriforma conspicua]|uniref:Gfo/Idh/MocA family protein n=1 Tax=Crateriforma conspicua TaxID=2527996 RepID=UPI0011885D03|nr:Gfo/Idh/MocA family oxidoreductase [Crateriforma conspicua]QDV64785.1 Inositol 2-dehydrogenase [Crateriforma conspicua]
MMSSQQVPQQDHVCFDGGSLQSSHMPTRRDALRSAAAATVGLGYHAATTAASPLESDAPSDVIRIGVIGTGNRARQLMDQLPKAARVVAICDCYQKRADETLAKFDAKWPTYSNHRQMLDRESLDAVIIATPDHGRSLPCIDACQAGLDVYAEKPLTAYVSEGREIVRAARQNNTVFQVGTQQRTMEINDYLCRQIREGNLGRVRFVQAVNYTGPKRYQRLPAEPIPQGDDWDRWCGPTPLRPFHSSLQFGWMQWRAYSGGEMTNWGAHGVDQIQWALGKSLTGPTQFIPVTGGPNGKVTARYDDGLEVRFELDQGPQGGAIFQCDAGKVEINRNRFATNPADLIKNAPDSAVQAKWEKPGWIAGPHLANWLQCIRTRQRPNADVEIGHRSITFCHLVNLTRELGRTLNWDPKRETFINDDEANSLLTRPRRSGYELPVT